MLTQAHRSQRGRRGRRIKKAWKELEPRLPEDVAYDVMYDRPV